jgi:hypothetical protein
MVLQLQGAWTLCEEMSQREQQSKQTRWREEGPPTDHMLQVQTKGALHR